VKYGVVLWGNLWGIERRNARLYRCKTWASNLKRKLAARVVKGNKPYPRENSEQSGMGLQALLKTTAGEKSGEIGAEHMVLRAGRGRNSARRPRSMSAEECGEEGVGWVLNTIRPLWAAERRRLAIAG
jgi:hypothetical protein